MIIKTLSAVAFVTAVLSSPVFAQDQTAPQKPVQALQQHHRGVYNQVQEPAVVGPGAAATGSYFDHESFDRARIGNHDPDFSPSGS